jgi:predicted glycogen debranching enzyme
VAPAVGRPAAGGDAASAVGRAAPGEAGVCRVLRMPATEAPAGGRHGREWLVTNGLGGYASGEVSGGNTRRYHGLLIAALPAPFGRMVMLDQLLERARAPGGPAVPVGGAAAGRARGGRIAVTEFRLEWGLPVWRFEGAGVRLEKRLVLPYRQNTVHVTYRNLGTGRLRLQLRPAVHFRAHEAPVDEPTPGPYALTVAGHRYELAAGPRYPTLRLRTYGPAAPFHVAARGFRDRRYPTEAARGYPSRGELWTPGYFRVTLGPGESATVVGSTETWETLEALTPETAASVDQVRRRRLLAAAPAAARSGAAAELVLAADQFIVQPAGRVGDQALTHASGDEARTVIAGYHWFTDWGRDTMIGLEGLALVTGRHVEAGYILRTFAHYLQDGLIPNTFPEGNRQGFYNTADATLWFFHALDRYVEHTGDRTTLRLLLPRLLDVVEHHVRGTRFGIGVDPADGLLRQGEEGYALTWMDAKVGDWVVTPRRGKTVEINALWHNALRLLEGWTREEGSAELAGPLGARADVVRRSFNARFWYPDGGYLYDLVDGEHGPDPACRPNQIFALALRHPVLDPSRWRDVLRVVQERLLTPVGLRTLAPGHPDYKPTYHGDLRARDAAYHQGTVWPWLVGALVDAWLRVHPDDAAGARGCLDALWAHLNEACVGSISEIFDAEPPFTPRGCIAQGWSVAEVLRAWVRTAAPGGVSGPGAA